MEFNQRFWVSIEVLLLVFLMGLSVFAVPDSIFGSEAHTGRNLLQAKKVADINFDSQAQIGRNLLQAKKGCPVNFEFLNYTIITRQCKAPKYPASKCCAAFKEFACPYANVLNDLTNDCATTMFKYINLYGKYPPGLFATQCREGKDGLTCPAAPPPQPPPTSTSP